MINIIDLEATCWKGPPPPDQTSEIIEIGICVVDTSGWSRVERRSILVRPQASTVSEFCTELTSLTQEQVDQGVSFEEACAILRDEFDSRSRTWTSWGDYDRKQFLAQCRAESIGYPLGNRHVNAKARFGKALGLRPSPGMARALALAGLPLEGRHHRGDDDAWNIAALVIELARRGLPIT
jgi:inhibitor of KinA sporulation pathway (predicted exonuclease)